MKKQHKKAVKLDNNQGFDGHELVFNPRFITAVFNSIGTGICVTDERGKFVDVNNAHCRLYGYARDELIGQSFTLLVPSAHRKHLQKLHDSFFSLGKEPPAEFEVINKQGETLKCTQIFAQRCASGHSHKRDRY